MAGSCGIKKSRFDLILKAAMLVMSIAYTTNSLYCPKLVGSRTRTRIMGLNTSSAKLVVRAKARITVDFSRLGTIHRLLVTAVIEGPPGGVTSKPTPASSVGECGNDGGRQ